MQNQPTPLPNQVLLDKERVEQLILESGLSGKIWLICPGCGEIWQQHAPADPPHDRSTPILPLRNQAQLFTGFVRWQARLEPAVRSRALEVLRTEGVEAALEILDARARAHWEHQLHLRASRLAEQVLFLLNRTSVPGAKRWEVRNAFFAWRTEQNTQPRLTCVSDPNDAQYALSPAEA